MDEVWSPDEIAMLRALKAERRSLSYIAKQVKRTRGAVSGRWQRLNGYKRKYVRSGKPRAMPIDPRYVLAAAIVLDAIEAAMEETGLSRSQIGVAVQRSKDRDYTERRKHQQESAHAL